MKLQLDFDNKIIKVEQRVNLSELFDKLYKLLDQEWKEWTLDTNTKIVWDNSNTFNIHDPINIPWIQNPYISNPPGYTIKYTPTNGTETNIKMQYDKGVPQGIYNVEI